MLGFLSPFPSFLIWKFEYKLKIYLFHMSVLSVYMFVHYMEIRKKHQMLQKVVRDHVIIDNPTQVLYKSSQCSQPLIHLSSLIFFFLI